MRLERRERLVRAYRRLTVQERRQVDAHLHLLVEDPRHPSLCACRWPGTDIWHARMSRDIRLFSEIHEDSFLLLDVGHHDIDRSW